MKKYSLQRICLAIAFSYWHIALTHRSATLPSIHPDVFQDFAQ